MHRENPAGALWSAAKLRHHMLYLLKNQDFFKTFIENSVDRKAVFEV